MPIITKIDRSELCDIQELPALKEVEPKTMYFKEYIKGHSTLLLIPYFEELRSMQGYYEVNGSYYEPLFTNELEYWQELEQSKEDKQMTIYDFI